MINEARALREPLGLPAVEHFQSLARNSFDANVRLSNDWITKHIAAYDQAAADYQALLEPLMEGASDGSMLGMRFWLTDPDNVEFWDKAVQRNVGDEGYALLTALNLAFEPLSTEFQLAYGGHREYDPASGLLVLNGTAFERPVKGPFEFAANSTLEQKFDQLVRFGDAVRQAMLQFYQASAEGKIDQILIGLFNETYVLASGCALANTNVLVDRTAEQYLFALNLMAQTLAEAGFRIEQ